VPIYFPAEKVAGAVRVNGLSFPPLPRHDPGPDVEPLQKNFCYEKLAAQNHHQDQEEIQAKAKAQDYKPSQPEWGPILSLSGGRVGRASAPATFSAGK
jgi:hypothetical protein